VARGLFAVAGLTIANGADNISVYAPTFRSVGVARSAVMIVVFAVLVGVACAAGAALGLHRRVVAMVGRIGHWLVPAVFVAIGVVIIVGSDPLGALR
jgi:cadmium resistance protein CadD (predicted permease)